MSTLIQDVRYGLRALRRNPGFAAIALVTLAFGIGANSAIFSLVSALMLRPLPGVLDPSALVMLRGTPHDLSYPAVVAYRTETAALAGLAAFKTWDMDVRTGDLAGRVRGAMVSSDYFRVLGVSPALGRMFLPDEEAVPGGHPLAVIGYELWRDRLNGDSGAVGSTVRINAHAFTVIGVAPADFRGSSLFEHEQIWVPLDMHRQIAPGLLAGVDGAEFGWLSAVARLRPGMAVTDAVVQIRTIDDRRPGVSPRSERQRAVVAPLRADEQAFVGPYLALLAAIVGVVLLIACANVAGLLLARGVSRRREIAIRAAVGAGRGRVVRQLLIESLVLAGGGAAAGLPIAGWATRVIAVWIRTAEPTFPRWISLAPDARVLAFTVVAALATALLFGAVPALHASHVDLVTDLKDGAPLGSRSHATLRKLLVASQVAMSVVLLIAAGHLLQTLRQQWARTPVTAPDRVLQVALDPASAGYDVPGASALYQGLLTRIATLPSVSAVSLGRNPLPWDGSFFDETAVVAGPEGPDTLRGVRYDVVSPGYFSVMGRTLIRGRAFDDGDREGQPRVAIVNERFARRFWPGENPVGKRFRISAQDEREVVGVAPDRSRSGQAAPFIYLPIAQPAPWPHSGVHVHVRVTGRPESLLPALRREIALLDADLPVLRPSTLDQILRDSEFDRRLLATVLGVAGLLALGLSAIGLYGLIAHSVGQRLPEFGVRRALGAGGGDLLAVILGDGVPVIGAGLALGVVAALGATRSLLRVVSETGDAGPSPAVFGVAVGTLALVGVLACLIPARRAMRVDPVTALRAE